MSAYVISEVEMLDETQGRRYRELAAGSIARHGGRYLARGSIPVVAEGNWPANCRIVIVEFPTMERLQAWYASVDYAEALAVRQTALDRRLLFVDGAHTSPGLGWPDTVEDLRRDRVTEPHLAPLPAAASGIPHSAPRLVAIDRFGQSWWLQRLGKPVASPAAAEGPNLIPRWYGRALRS